ncbi:MAG TPA: hypothetical protein VGG32_04135 [Thermoplasmata archaeon]|jgi:hypothetical protein
MEWVPEKGQASRRLLLDREDLRRRLFEIATGSKITEAQLAGWIKSFNQLVEEAGLSGDAHEQFRAIVPDLRKGSPLNADELAFLSGLLEQSFRNLEGYFRSEFATRGAANPSSLRLTRHLSRLLDTDLSVTSGFGGRTKLEVLETYVRSNPGLFIHAVYRRLNSPVRRAGFSYANVWNLVQHLVNERRLLTVGGPRGHNRYCFPHPDTIEDRTQYYGQPYAIDSVLTKKWTDSFDLAKIRKFWDIFEGNSIARNPVLIVVDYGRLESLQGQKIRSFGWLEPFGHLEAKLGLLAQRSVPRKDVLLVGGVSRIDREGRETPFWVSEDVQESLRISPSQLVGPQSS